MKIKLRAASYRRVSSQEQAADDKVSLEIQDQDIRAQIERKGYQHTHDYVDAGYSGDTKNRPQFQQMLKDLQAGLFDVIVVWRGDRLVRGLRPTVALKDALEGTDVQIEATNDFINRRWLSMKAAMAEEELEAIRERSRMGHRGRAAKGKIISSPYGYALDQDGKPVIVDDQAEDVREIYAWYLKAGPDRETYETIAQEFNNRGKLTRRGNPWSKQDIGLILTNEAYTGTSHWGKRRRYKKDNGNGKDVSHIKKLPEEEWIEIPFPPIIDKDTFRAAQERRKHYTIQRVGRMETLSFPLKGILWCDQHHRPYTASYTANPGESVYRYYECPLGSRHHKEHGKCPMRKPSAGKLEQTLMVWVYKYLLDPDRLEELKANYMDRLRNGGGLEVLERTQAKLQALDEETGRVKIAYERGWRTEEEADLRVRAIREEKEYHEEELAAAEEKFGDLKGQLDALEALGDRDQVRAAWRNLNQLGPEKLLQTVAKKVVITGPDRFEVTVNAQNLAELSNPLRCS